MALFASCFLTHVSTLSGVLYMASSFYGYLFTHPEAGYLEAGLAEPGPLVGHPSGLTPLQSHDDPREHV
jgi:hypothetical protein